MRLEQPKYVDNSHYHLWTDVLHGRALAHQAYGKWDRATYVRWTIVTAWTVLEVACQDALDVPEIGRDFFRDVSSALVAKTGHELELGRGIWQRVAVLKWERKKLVHRFLDIRDLFPGAGEADRAIKIVRAAVKDIYHHAGKPVPVWIDDDQDPGWNQPDRFGANLTLIWPGADPDGPETIRIVFVRDGQEYPTTIMPPGSSFMPEVERIRQDIREPISAIRVYAGQSLIYDEKLRMRGSEDA